MRSTEREPLIPLWDNSDTISSPTRSEETNTTTPTMILVSVPEALHSALRALVRDVDGVEADLRRKIAEHLPPIEDEHDPLAARKPRCSDAAERGGGQQSGGVSLPPATLARALPHIRRLMPPVGEGGMLALLKGGGLVFPDKPSNTPPLKQGEEKEVYEQRRNRLIQLQEQKEYARMTSNIHRAPRETVRDIQASFKFQAGIGANTLLAALSAFIISFWASKFFIKDNNAHRLVIGLVGAVFMMLVELLVFVTRSMKADKVLEQARKNVEQSHTAVGVHRSIPPPTPRTPPRAGRGVLEMKNDDRGGCEMVPGIGGDDTEQLLPSRGAPRSERGSDAGIGIASTSSR